MLRLWQDEVPGSRLASGSMNEYRYTTILMITIKSTHLSEIRSSQGLPPADSGNLGKIILKSTIISPGVKLSPGVSGLPVSAWKSAEAWEKAEFGCLGLTDWPSYMIGAGAVQGLARLAFLGGDCCEIAFHRRNRRAG
jgi:hypothetical protein